MCGIATGQEAEVDDELATWALATWQLIVPAEGRTGDAFEEAVPANSGASPLDQLIAFTGRVAPDHCEVTFGGRYAVTSGATTTSRSGLAISAIPKWVR